MDGDDSIHALADAIDSKLGGPIVNGSVVMPVIAANGNSTLSVTLPAGRFAAPPAVFCQTGHGRIMVSVSSITATGFVFSMLNVTAVASTALTSYWRAEALIS